MPELPEVETVKRGLERTVVGKTIASVDVRVPKIFADSAERIDAALTGATIVAAERRAKVLLVRLDNSWTLAIHLKMTGQLVAVGPETRKLGTGFIAGHPEKAYEHPLPHKHTHVIIKFTDGTTLYFNDLRKFGWFKLVASNDLPAFMAAMNYGPEPFDAEFTPDYLYRVVKQRSIPIKTLLLNQSVIAGVGNIYADEALFRSRIHPLRPSKTLTAKEVRDLTNSVREVIRLGIEHGGTTLNTYVNTYGTPGRMRQHLKVYGRDGTPCQVCDTELERLKIGQRSSHFCPNCQQ